MAARALEVRDKEAAAPGPAAPRGPVLPLPVRSWRTASELMLQSHLPCINIHELNCGSRIAQAQHSARSSSWGERELLRFVAVALHS